ncbi:GNAT family N-acetyltransferase [Leucobacter sp. USHLN154]|uniref:GNAT family N-acetyltransferase n=1 Tax=Leucobacter sp. USHLN154 TaxID=3081269 RepID=UPI000A6968C9
MTAAPPSLATSAAGGATADREAFEVRIVHPSDPLAQPLLADLEREYDARYGVEVFGEPAAVEMNRYPLDAFAAPNGAFIVLLLDGEPVSGGACMRYDERTAEFKRVWTRTDLRGRGLARRVLSALEQEAGRLGYQRVTLTTGPRQPEAVALYLRAGYTPLFDQALDAATIGIHAFAKTLPPIVGRAAPVAQGITGIAPAPLTPTAQKDPS